MIQVRCAVEATATGLAYVSFEEPSRIGMLVALLEKTHISFHQSAWTVECFLAYGTRINLFV
jgi:hypothetical protein